MVLCVVWCLVIVMYGLCVCVSSHVWVCVCVSSHVWVCDVSVSHVWVVYVSVVMYGFGMCQ